MAPPRRFREQEVLEFIRRYEAKHKIAPSYREIAEALGLSSPNSVSKYVRRLRAEGKLDREPRTHRGLRVVVGDGDGEGSPGVGADPAGVR